MTENTAAQSHSLILQNRRILELGGVTDVDSFDENSVKLYTELGELEVRGKGLHVNLVDVKAGKLSVEGEIAALIYGEKGIRKKPSFVAKIFR